MAKKRNDPAKKESDMASPIMPETDVNAGILSPTTEEPEDQPIPLSSTPEEIPAPPAPHPISWVWTRDINFGQHRPGDLFDGTEEEAAQLLAKEWIKQA